MVPSVKLAWIMEIHPLHFTLLCLSAVLSLVIALKGGPMSNVDHNSYCKDWFSGLSGHPKPIDRIRHRTRSCVRTSKRLRQKNSFVACSTSCESQRALDLMITAKLNTLFTWGSSTVTFVPCILCRRTSIEAKECHLQGVPLSSRSSHNR